MTKRRKYAYYVVLCVAISFASFKSISSQEFKVFGDSILQGKWTSIGPKNVTGAILSAEYDAIDSSYTIASKSGYFYYKKESEVDWRLLNLKRKFYDLAGFTRHTANNTSYITSISNDGVAYHSTNNGGKWIKSQGLTNLEGFSKVQKVIKGPNGNVFVLLEERLGQFQIALYQSKDYGRSFSKVKTFNSPIPLSLNNYDIANLHYSDSAILVAYVDTLSLYNCHTDSFNYHSRIPAFTFGEARVAGTYQNNQLQLFLIRGQALYQYNTAQSFWSKKSNISFNTATPYSFSVAHNQYNKLAIGSDLLHKSNDTGKTWTVQNTLTDYLNNTAKNLHSGINEVQSALTPNNQAFNYVSTDGGFYISQDGFNSVINLTNEDLNNTSVFDIKRLKNNDITSIIAFDNQGLHKYSGTTVDTQLLTAPLEWGDFYKVSTSTVENSFWVLNSNSIAFVSDFSNQFFNARWRFGDSLETGAAIGSLCAHPTNGRKAYASGMYAKNDGNKSCYVYELTISGNSIDVKRLDKNFNLNFFKTEFVEDFAIDKVNPDNWYLITNDGNFYYTNDNGVNWKRSAFFNGLLANENFGSCIAPSVNTEGLIFVGGSGNGNGSIYTSSNYGKDFSLLGDGLKETEVYDIESIQHDSLIFTATKDGPMVFSREKNTWESLLIEEIPNKDWLCLDINSSDSSIWFGTFGQGVYAFDYRFFKDSVNSVASLDHKKSDLRIFPNPSSDVLNIRSVKTIRMISISSVTGKEMYTARGIEGKSVTLNEQMEPGIYFIKVQLTTNETLLKKWIKY